MASKETQRNKIIQYCKCHGSITIREAFERLHINSPSKRISEIRQSGFYQVDDVMESNVNSDGETVKFKRYFIKDVIANG